MNPLPRKTHDDDRSMHGTLFAVAVLMLALLFAPQADAQPRPNASQDQAQAQAQPVVPDWVVPGARITQYATSAQHTKRNRARNNRWREEEERARQRDIDAGLPMEEVERRARQREEQRARDSRLYHTPVAGNCYLQYDVLAVTDAGVLMELRAYNIHPLSNGPPELSHVVITRLYDHATGGGLWMSPAMIERTLAAEAQDNVGRSYRGTYTLGGQDYDAVSIVISSGDIVIRRTYDIATGIQLYQSQVTDTDDLRSHQSSELADYRVAQLPWIGTQFTGQVQGFNKLRYAGAFVLVMPQDPAQGRTPDVRNPMEVEFTIDTPAEDTLGVTIQAEIQGLGPNGPVEHEAMLTPNARLGLYIDPAVLARLERGQVLDEDTVVGYTIRVTDIYQVNGTTLVELTESGRGDGHTVVVTYDAGVGLQVDYVGNHPMQDRRIELMLEGVE